MTYVNTTQDIKERTSLSDPFIRKVITECEIIFEPFLRRGDKNQMLFDESGMMLWDLVYQSKQQGFTVPQIKKELEKALSNKSNIEGTKPDTQSNNNKYSDIYFDKFLEQFKIMTNQLVSSKDDTIKAKDNVIQELNKQLLFLTDGKPAEVIKNEIHNKDLELIRLEYQLKQKESEEISLKSEIENHKILAKSANEINKKVSTLIQELSSLKGWFIGKKKKELTLQIIQLNNNLN